MITVCCFLGAVTRKIVAIGKESYAATEQVMLSSLISGQIFSLISQKLLSGEISSPLLRLRHLTYLDLSCNYFNIQPLPNFICSLTELQYLNLSCTGIVGTIPQQLGNLTSLISLDLRGNGLLEDHNLDWLFHLSSLRYLDMTFVNLSKAVYWLDKVSVHPSLKELYLYNSLPADLHAHFSCAFQCYFFFTTFNP